MDLKDKRILVTGASSGLGAVAAVEFSKLGAQLALVARSEDRLNLVREQCSHPEKHIAVSADLLVIGDIHSAVEKCRAFLGDIDIVLHVAGGGLGYKKALLSHDELLTLFTLNLGAAAEINRLIAPMMIKNCSGHLVHVGSIASHEAVGSVGYNTVKSALAGYVRTLGRELAEHQIVATGILPGGFLAPHNAMNRLKSSNPEAYQAFIDTRLPRKKMGDALEVIPLLVLLCSESASMMAGCMVPIDAAEGRAYNLD